MNKRTVASVCLMALVSLHEIQQVPALKLLKRILSQVKPSECNGYISPGGMDVLPPVLQPLIPPQLQPQLPPQLQPQLPPQLQPLQPYMNPNESFELIEELLQIRRLLEQGCRPANLPPLDTDANYPPSVSQGGYTGSLNNQ
ncbi:uncharacterized protein LOC144470664 [Augochlora pura]